MSIIRGLGSLTLLLVLALPVYAQDNPFDRPDLAQGPTFASIVNGSIVPIVDTLLIPLLYAIAFVVFLVGMVRLFFSTSEEKRKSGKQFALWGLIGFAVLFGIWGIVRVFLSTLQSAI